MSEHLQSSQLLLKPGTYGAFQCVINFAKEEDNFQPKGSGDDHGRLLNHFKARGKGPRRRIYVSLEQMRNNRWQADYESALISNPQSLAHATLLDAKMCLMQSSNLKVEPLGRFLKFTRVENLTGSLHPW